jgi:hypothetical protein
MEYQPTIREPVPEHSVKDFTWEPEKRSFVAELSDFSDKKPWKILYEGGFKVPYCRLKNPATGRSVLFVFLHTLESEGPDSEIEAWVFGPTLEEIEKRPKLFGLRVVFLND